MCVFGCIQVEVPWMVKKIVEGHLGGVTVKQIKINVYCECYSKTKKNVFTPTRFLVAVI